MRQESYTAYHADVQNTGGALLFLAYIAAALVFSFRVAGRIFKQFQAQRSTASPKQRAFIALAALSFSALSYNMLSFLWLSYLEYTIRHDRRHRLADSHTWEWMSHSSLFEDFAHALVRSRSSVWWTQLALIISHVAIGWIAKTCKCAAFGLGLRHLTSLYSVRSNDITGLGDLFAISQILPISFTINLAVLLIVGHDISRSTRRHDQKQMRVISSTSGFGLSSNLVQLAVTGAFLCALATVPNLSTEPQSILAGSTAMPKPVLLPLVFFIRMLLASPYFTEDGLPRLSMTLPLITIGGAALQIRETSRLWKQPAVRFSQLVDEVLFGHPSVRTFGQDALLAIISAAAWVLL